MKHRWFAVGLLVYLLLPAPSPRAAAPPLPRVVTAGLDAVFVAGLINKLNGAFVVDSSIKTPADLKNKTLKAAVMKSLARGLRLPRTEDALEGYEAMLTLYQRRLTPTTEGIRNAIQVIGATNEKIRALKAEDLADERFVK